MASNINSTIPVAGANLLAEPIRNNFIAAKSEIEALQLTVDDTMPENPQPGMKWIQGTTGIEWTYVDDGTSQQWIEVGTAGPAVIPGIAGYQYISSLILGAR